MDTQDTWHQENSQEEYQNGSFENDKNPAEGYKLIDTKLARKKAEDNALKLENRIKLLEKEKKRMMKKIQQVKKKALQIMKIKKRNKEIEE